MEKFIYIIESVKQKGRQGDKQLFKLNNQQWRNGKWVGVNETNSH